MSPRRRVPDPDEATAVSDGRQVLGSFSGRAPRVAGFDVDDKPIGIFASRREAMQAIVLRARRLRKD
jgi:hypothetical protein